MMRRSLPHDLTDAGRSDVVVVAVGRLGPDRHEVAHLARSLAARAPPARAATPGPPPPARRPCSWPHAPTTSTAAARWNRKGRRPEIETPALSRTSWVEVMGIEPTASALRTLRSAN